MIHGVKSISDISNYSAGKRETGIDIENCSPDELEKFINGMYQKGEITLKETLVFKPLDLAPLADEAGIDPSKISQKYFSKVYDEPDKKRNLYRDYRSILNQMIIDGESSQNIAVMKNATRLLDRLKGLKSFETIYQNTISKI